MNIKIPYAVVASRYPLQLKMAMKKLAASTSRERGRSDTHNWKFSFQFSESFPFGSFEIRSPRQSLSNTKTSIRISVGRWIGYFPVPNPNEVLKWYERVEIEAQKQMSQQ